MNQYHKIVILSIILITPNHIVSSMKNVPRLAKITNLKNTPIKGKLNSLKLQTKDIYHNVSSTLEHPLYKKFVEPIYVGNKTKYWNSDVKHYWENIKTNIHNSYVKEVKTKPTRRLKKQTSDNDDKHDKTYIPPTLFQPTVLQLKKHNNFTQNIYLPWKKQLTTQERKQFAQDLKKYEQAYQNYLNNPYLPQTNQQFIKQMIHIQAIMYLQTPAITENLKNINQQVYIPKILTRKQVPSSQALKPNLQTHVY